MGVSEKRVMEIKLQTIDDIEKVRDWNEVIENSLSALDNIASDVSTHQDLLHYGIFDLLALFIEQFIQVSRESQNPDLDADEDEASKPQHLDSQVDITSFPDSTLCLLKCLASLFMKLS